MPGSYYSDVERTIYLTYVILVEDIAKYDELFQQERKFLSFEYWSAHVSQIDYDDPSAAEASKPEGPPEIDYSNAAAGCNGYPWSEMRRSVGGRCKPDGTDDDVTSVAAVLAAKNTMALFGLACLVGFGVSL